MFYSIPSNGKPEGKSFGIIGELFMSDAGKLFIKKNSDMLNIGWDPVGSDVRTTLSGSTSVTTAGGAGGWTFTATSVEPIQRIRFQVDGHSDGSWYNVPGNSLTFSSSSNWGSPFGSPDISASPGGPYNFYFEAEDIFGKVGRSDLFVSVIVPTPTPTPTMTITPTFTPTPTPTPTLMAPGIYLTSSSFATNGSSRVFTNDSAITSLSKYKLRARLNEMMTLYPYSGIEQRANTFNTASAPLSVPPVGDYTTQLYYEQFNASVDGYGIYQSTGTGSNSVITVSVATASGFSPLTPPGNVLAYLSTSSFQIDNPPYVYTSNSSILSYPGYKIRCKLTGDGAADLNYIYPGDITIHRSVSLNNNYSAIIPPSVGKWTAEIYGIAGTVITASYGYATMSIATASGFTPVTPPAYTSSGDPNVYLSSTTFDYRNPPYIYTTSPVTLATNYRLRAKFRVWNGSAWQLLPSSTEHRAVGWNNQYGQIIPPYSSSAAPQTYQADLYWITYTNLFDLVTGASVGSPNTVTVIVNPSQT